MSEVHFYLLMAVIFAVGGDVARLHNRSAIIHRVMVWANLLFAAMEIYNAN